MNTPLVTLINPNKIHPPITPYALDILTTSLEASGFTVEVVDLTFRREDWHVALREYFRDRRPLLVGVTVRNTDTIYPQEQRVFLEEHREIIHAVRALSDAPVVAGGVGFSSMPFALVDYFGIDYGVKGPGEHIICDLARALADRTDPSLVPGLLTNRGAGTVVRTPPADGPPALLAAERPVLAAAGFGETRDWQVNRGTAYRRRGSDPTKVDNLEYYRRGGLGNILTKNGCPFTCSHCVEPDAKGNRFARRGIEAVADEMEALTALGVHDLHTTDSEFNLAVANSKALLREIVRRKDRDHTSPLHRLRLWIYAQPAPFDEELAELLAAAGCAGVNLAPDHVRDDLLDGWKVTGKGTRFYTFDDVVNAVRLTHKYHMLSMVEVLLGMPGETRETVRECVERTMALDATVVGFTLGLRIFPYSPLGMWCAERSAGRVPVPGVQSNTATEPIVIRTARQCSSPLAYERQFMFEESGAIRPLYYFSPDLDEDESTLGAANGRWLRTVEFLWDLIPEHDVPRVMLPTAPGLTEHDNNYADNPFLTSLVHLGYKGAFWSHWRERDQIMRKAALRGAD
ncbi:tryptophan 2-C-methyltransferase [Streptomyces sp. NPDC008313]|uniref:tryptophan 2-C-methyltransferase n=1 Tax=Streptomyces sp. NPDC008313 TaxID=3364826 RepID=UPI0036ECA3CA